MDIQDYVRIVKERWKLVAITVVVVTLGAFIPTLFTKPVYQTSTLLYVSSTQPRLATYAELLTGKKLAQRTIDELGLDMTPAELVANVKATPVPELLLHVKVQDTSPERARDIADTLSAQFVSMMDELAATDIEAAAANKDAQPPQVLANPGTAESGYSITMEDPDPKPARVSVEQNATVPTEPLPTSDNRNVVLGLAVGLLLGIALAVIRDWLDATVKDRRAVEGQIGAPLTGITPDGTESSGVVDMSDATSPMGAAYRQLRTNLQFADAANPPHVIVVASPSPGEGSDATALNLGVALAAAGQNVCVVEADLRKPLVASTLGIRGATGAGLSSVLRGETDLADAIRATTFEHLSLLPSGPLPANPSELLGSATARTVVATLRDRFDYVVFAGAPLLPVTDSAVLSAISDGALIVARYGRTKRQHLAEAADILHGVGATIVGGLLVGAREGTRGPDTFREYLEPQAASTV
ncbi:polysaccharide biosynthesis tyrosine autokinase [Rhodococcus sp. NPDC057014]|uniref:polysaccharide biosynthesis tyrosine autokinase n=1 Tax=Rhodococcus sp. NPDC057014 TaxID=3346000 RepID=UPI003638D55B